MKNFVKYALAFCGLLVLCACGGDGSNSSSGEPVNFNTIDLPVVTAIPAGTYVFKSQAELNAVWYAAPSTFPGDFTPGLVKPAPIIDFTGKQVVAVSLGVGTRCYIPTITAVFQSADRTLVQYHSAAPDGPTTLACLHHWPLVAMAAVPVASGRVDFLRL